MPAIDSVHNLRDVGGDRTSDGRRVRTGLLYRAAGLARLAPGDDEAFRRLGVRTVFDLRMAEEQAREPDRLPAGVRHVPVDVLSEWGTTGQPAAFERWFNDPAAARAALGGGAGQAMWEGQYRAFVELPSARAAYGSMFRVLATEGGRPALVHCTTGKDRTGWAAASLQLLLGVPTDAVMAHYLRSGLFIAPLVEPVLAALAARGGDPELFRPVFDVRPAYLDSAMAEVRERYGSIEGYFADGLGLDAATRAALRDAFLE
jgi:protein-tyrosine phosphatase